MITCTRKFDFDYGHRVLGHGGKCRHLHGHRGVAEVTVTSKDLDNLGMVIDFSVVKEKVGRWIDENWDHNFLCHENDAIAKIWQAGEGGYGWGLEEMFGRRRPFVMPSQANPTAEQMARHLHFVASVLLEPLKVTNVRIWETPNCFADYTPEG